MTALPAYGRCCSQPGPLRFFATLAALFIGEVMGQAPCLLCWFQRAFVLPLVVILAVACFRSDGGVWRYALPLAGFGGIIAGFHILQCCCNGVSGLVMIDMGVAMVTGRLRRLGR